jgi:hypothetical protein
VVIAASTGLCLEWSFDHCRLVIAASTRLRYLQRVFA